MDILTLSRRIGALILAEGNRKWLSRATGVLCSVLVRGFSTKLATTILALQPSFVTLRSIVAAVQEIWLVATWEVHRRKSVRKEIIKKYAKARTCPFHWSQIQGHILLPQWSLQRCPSQVNGTSPKTRYIAFQRYVCNCPDTKPFQLHGAHWTNIHGLKTTTGSCLRRSRTACSLPLCWVGHEHLFNHRRYKPRVNWFLPRDVLQARVSVMCECWSNEKATCTCLPRGAAPAFFRCGYTTLGLYGPFLCSHYICLAFRP